MSAETDLTLEIVEETPIELNLVEETPITIEMVQTGARGADGAQGEDGVAGQDGADGQGVPTGGAAGQIPVKQSATDFDVEWGYAPYYAYVFDTDADENTNGFGEFVFNDWATLQGIISGREAKIQFKQDFIVPQGAWNIDYQIWLGNGSNPDGGGLTITFETGVTLSSAINWICQNGLNIHSTSDDPIYVMTTPHAFIFDRARIFTDNAEFVKVEAAGLIAVQVSNGFGLYNDAGNNAGNYEVFNIASAPYTTILVLTENGISPNIQNNTVRSTVPFIYGWLKQTSEANSGFATHANIDPFSVNFNGVPLGDGGSLFSNAQVIGFIQGQPAGITSSNVSDALAELAARIEVLEGYH